ncbi:MAG: hydrogenase expression protein HypE [Cytophagaceae bacterium]|nr:hydrogenase expression protein HypE [Gemmatimonadaceae bacterium]
MSTATEPIRGGQPSIPETLPEKHRETLPLGPLKNIHVFWMAGMSCDGCTITVAGATNPGVEGLLNGTVPAMPKMLLHHPVLSVEAGAEFMQSFRDAWERKLEDPYVVVFEGSVPDERIAARTGGYWSAMGSEVVGEGSEGEGRLVPTTEWLSRLAPGAAATIAIGTCATWGGVPAAEGNPTGAMSVMDFLGKDYRSAFGLPVINIPGCAPQGDNFTETVFAILLFLQGLGPLPAFDELGRPSWLYGETVHRGCTRAGYYEEGVFTHEYGGAECLVEIGCWGPVVNCNIVKRGAINHMGGCMEAGGVCIACTMPGFPDKFSPFYKAPPGGIVSTATSRSVGGVIRRLRRLSNRHANRERRWDVNNDVPSGWAHLPKQNLGLTVMEFFYQKWQLWGARKPGRRPGEEERFWGATRPGKPSDYHDTSVSEGK